MAFLTVELIVINFRFDFANKRIYSQPKINDNYYFRRPHKKTDYKVFHKIPSSSLLLTSYDPFYSPLLSRLDSVFQQLGLTSDKTPETERCRERLVCMMYANPAKYAPYSNLVSAQLSRYDQWFLKQIVLELEILAHVLYFGRKYCSHFFWCSSQFFFKISK